MIKPQVWLRNERKVLAIYNAWGLAPVQSIKNRGDLKIWDTYRPVARTIRKAGWRPITYATVNNPDITVCERFGKQAPYYFTYLSLEGKGDGVITIDLKSLGLDSVSSVKEILAGVKVSHSVKNGKLVVKVHNLEKDMLKVIELR